MKVATVQLDISWENTDQNLSRLDALLANIPDDVELVVLPEMFNTGFSMNPTRIATLDGGEALGWMKRFSSENQTAVVGSIATKTLEGFYNRLYWVFPDGQFQTYDKRHLFRMANENEVYKSGAKKLIVEWKGIKLCPLICYD